MSDIGSATSMFVAMQAQARAQTMSTHALKQQATQEQAVADMLTAAAQASGQQPSSPPPGQGLAVDIRV